MENVNMESSWEISKHLLKKNKWKVVIVIGFGLALLFFVPQAGVLLIVAPIIYYYLVAHGEFMRYFAVSNNMAYAETGKLEDTRGRLYKLGKGGEITNVVSGAWNNFPIRIFNFSHELSSGKDKHTRYFTVLEISFEKLEFPFIFLKSKKMWTVWMPSESSDTDVSLHERPFKLSVSKGYEIEAMQIFSESLLDYLSIKAPKYSIEFSQNRINIFSEGLVANKRKLNLLLDVGKHIIDSSGAFISRLSDDFSALHPYYLNKAK